MHISEELNKIQKNIRRPEPLPDPEFVSILEAYKVLQPAAKEKKDLNRFELFVVRKVHLPVFDASGTRQMSFNTERVEYVKDDFESLNELLRRFLKFRSDYLRAILYDNRLPSEDRKDRWIFHFDTGKISFSRLNEYKIRDNHIRKLNSIEQS